MKAQHTGHPLPLPLVPFEHYMLADDRPETPMTFFLRAGFTGEFEPRVFGRSVARAQERHPLFAAHLEGSYRDRTRRLKWVPAANQTPIITFSDRDAPIHHPDGDPYIDLHREVGVRFWVRQSNGQAEVLMQIHHAISDAMGATQFLEDLMGFYGEALDGHFKSGSYRQLDPTTLLGRGHFGMTSLDKIRRAPWDLSRATQFFQNTAEALATDITFDRKRKMGTFPFPAERRFFLHTDDLANLRRHGQSLGATINDVLLRDLFLAIDTWNQRQSSTDRRRSVRLAMPINLRQPRDQSMPAANVMSLAFLERSGKKLNHADTLLAGVVDETRLIKQRHLGLTLCRAAGLAGQVRGGLRFVLDPKRCYSTAVLSNLGAPLSDSPLPTREGKIFAGPVRLESLELLPPFRPATYAAFGVVTYGGHTAISLNVDPRFLRADAASDLLDTFEGYVRTSAGASRPALAISD